MNKKLFLIIQILLTACTPKYHTIYQYMPVEAESVKQCVNQCIGQKNSCLQKVNEEHRICQIRENYIYRLCILRQTRFNNLNRNNQFPCNLNNCSRDTEICESYHRQCYTNCGGEVRTKKLCVRDCENKDSDSNSISLYELGQLNNY